MEIKTQALCIKATDYGEKDKLLILLTAEYGKIVARIGSVRTPKSKLKICATPLCFGEYILNKTGNKYRVIGATAGNNFFESWSDVHKNCAAHIVIEALDKFTMAGVGAAEELKLALNALYAINYNEAVPYTYAAAFLVKLTALCGIDIEDYALVNPSVYSILNSLYNSEFEEMETLEVTIVDISRSLSYLANLYRARTGEKFVSLGEALKLMETL